MEELLGNQLMWVFLLAGGVVGLTLLVKAPEFYVAMLLVGPDYVQFALRLLGFSITRRTFAVVGAVVFIPIVMLFLAFRMMQAREEPILGRPNIVYVLLTLVVGVILLTGLTYTDGWFYGQRKTIDYFVFGLAPMFLAIVFLRDRAGMHRLLVWILLVTGSYVALVSGYSLLTTGTFFSQMMFGGEDVGGMELWGHGALSSPVVMSLGAILGFSATRRRGAFWSILPILFLPFAFIYVVLAGTRSNLLAFLVMATVGFYFTYKQRRSVFLVAIFLFVIAGAVLYMTVPDEVRERVFSSWIEEGTAAGGGGHERLTFIMEAPRMIFESPVVGHGTGDWPVLFFGLDAYLYPHNMFIEIAVENGLIGLAVLLLLWFIVIRRILGILVHHDPGEEIYGLAVFGGCLLAIEFTSAIAHFGLAHHSCTFLMTSAITLRATFLARSEIEEGIDAEAFDDSSYVGEPVLKAGPL